MKIVPILLTVMFAGLFLVYSSGLSYTQHTCHKSGETQIVLDAEYHCCESETSSCCQKEISCCDKPSAGDCLEESGHETCCSNLTNYFRTDEDYSPSYKTELAKKEINLMISFHSPGLQTGISTTHIQKSHGPPILCSSVDIYLSHSVLLI